MKNTLFIFTILSTLLLFSCNDDDNTQPDPEPELPTEYQQIDVVTGLDLFDLNGQPIGRFKIPNHKPGTVNIFPIPNNGILSIFSQQPIDKLWLIPAECALDTVNTDVFLLSQTLTYETVDLENKQIKVVENLAAETQFTLDFSEFSVGFYRIFYQLNNGDLFWRNIYLDPNFSGMVDFDVLDNACN